jgi:hypothetical protein
VKLVVAAAFNGLWVATAARMSARQVRARPGARGRQLPDRPQQLSGDLLRFRIVDLEGPLGDLDDRPAQRPDAERKLDRMEMRCAGCGCRVDRGVRLIPCGTVDCCCSDLTLASPVEIVAAKLRVAFADQDLELLGTVLVDDCRWGDDDAPNRCRCRQDVVATFSRVLGEGVTGVVTETAVDEGGVALGLEVLWPEPGPGRKERFWHAYLVRDGRVAEIQRHDDRRSTLRAIRR